jgi:hypothetical protein
MHIMERVSIMTNAMALERKKIFVSNVTVSRSQSILQVRSHAAMGHDGLTRDGDRVGGGGGGP